MRLTTSSLKFTTFTLADMESLLFPFIVSTCIACIEGSFTSAYTWVSSHSAGDAENPSRSFSLVERGVEGICVSVLVKEREEGVIRGIRLKTIVFKSLSAHWRLWTIILSQPGPSLKIVVRIKWGEGTPFVPL